MLMRQCIVGFLFIILHRMDFWHWMTFEYSNWYLWYEKTKSECVNKILVELCYCSENENVFDMTHRHDQWACPLSILCRRTTSSDTLNQVSKIHHPHNVRHKKSRHMRDHSFVIVVVVVSNLLRINRVSFCFYLSLHKEMVFSFLFLSILPDAAVQMKKDQQEKATATENCTPFRRMFAFSFLFFPFVSNLSLFLFNDC